MREGIEDRGEDRGEERRERRERRGEMREEMRAHWCGAVREWEGHDHLLEPCALGVCIGRALDVH